MIEIHVYHHFDPIGAPPSGPSAVDLILAAIQEMNSAMSEQLDNLTREVAESRSVTESAIAAFDGLGARLTAIQAELAAQGVTNERLDELATDLNTQQQQLADAIVRNTPAAPAEPVEE
jgi:hypothetical protein